MIRLLRPEPATREVTWRIRLADWGYEQFQRWLNRLGVPGAISNMDFHDKVNGCTIAVKVGLYYTTVTIDGRDYYFHRLTGRFDGTGQAV